MVTCPQVCHLECHQMADIQTAHTRHQVDIQPLREAIVAVHQDPFIERRNEFRPISFLQKNIYSERWKFAWNQGVRPLAGRNKKEL